jgi:hypothetical protein
MGGNPFQDAAMLRMIKFYTCMQCGMVMVNMHAVRYGDG